jgi:hypothetical protein
MHPLTFLLALIPATALAAPISAPNLVPTESNKDSMPKRAISYPDQAAQKRGDLHLFFPDQVEQPVK